MKYIDSFVLHGTNKILNQVYDIIFSMREDVCFEWNSQWRHEDMSNYLLFQENTVEFHNHDCSEQIIEINEENFNEIISKLDLNTIYEIY